MKKDVLKIIDILKDNSLRVTSSRKVIVEILVKSNNKYLSAEEIHQKISKSKTRCDLVSVYRILATLEELEIVKKTEFNNEATRYILKKDLNSSNKHEHYFKCNVCFTIEPFSGCFVSKIEKKLESSGYQNLSHHLEITGLCPSCAI